MDVSETQSPSASLPSGTVTFAFTDIEASTQRWERDRSAMQDAVRRHDATLRAVIVAHGGTVFKTMGDAFCTAFARPQDAVAAMLEAQTVLSAQDFSAVDGIRIRAAVHTGTADERDGDYFGPAVNRVARLLAIGHGGQVLVSGVATDLIQGVLPAQVSLRDLGEHLLKDLARPEQVYQLSAPGLHATFPPLRSLNVLPNNLPRMLTSFIGREKELREIGELVESHQLVTIVGSGGIGKTRTSLQVAANALDGSGDGVWFIELAPLASGTYIPAAVAAAFGVTLPADGDPLEHLIRVLAPKRALLVFDNCEHLVDAAAKTIAAIIRSCPRIRVLASSRQGLGIAGEATYRMPSLQLPTGTPSETLGVADTMQFAAVALFVERARAATNTFALTVESAPIVADICRRLDGIPLAIELAAARVKVLSPRQLRERLNERFRVLTGGNRDVLPRQQTLRALIDWSHDLLDERERALFRRLGIFVNGFTLDGAVAVGSVDDLDEIDVFDILASLTDKSLVLADLAGDALRYRLLESTRVYAREKLAASGELDDATERHLRYFRGKYVDAAARYEHTARVHELRELFSAEIEDVRAALDAAVQGDRDRLILGAELLAAAPRVWILAGAINEARVRTEAFLDKLPSDEPRLAAALLTLLSTFGSNVGRSVDAIDAATKALALARRSGDARTYAYALDRNIVALLRSPRFAEAAALLEEIAAQPYHSKELDLSTLRLWAVLHTLTGEIELSRRDNERLRKEYRATGDTLREIDVISNLAEVEHALGNTRAAIALSNETRVLRNMYPSVMSHLNQTLNLAGYFLAVDEIDAALAAGREAIRSLPLIEAESPMEAVALEHIALALSLNGELEPAVMLAGYAESVLALHGFARGFTERGTHERLFAILREKIERDELGRLLAQGAGLTPAAACALALEDAP